MNLVRRHTIPVAEFEVLVGRDYIGAVDLHVCSGVFLFSSSFIPDECETISEVPSRVLRWIIDQDSEVHCVITAKDFEDFVRLRDLATEELWRRGTDAEAD